MNGRETMRGEQVYAQCAVCSLSMHCEITNVDTGELGYIAAQK